MSVAFYCLCMHFPDWHPLPCPPCPHWQPQHGCHLPTHHLHLPGHFIFVTTCPSGWPHQPPMADFSSRQNTKLVHSLHDSLALGWWGGPEGDHAALVWEPCKICFSPYFLDWNWHYNLSRAMTRPRNTVNKQSMNDTGGPVWCVHRSRAGDFGANVRFQVTW